MQWSVICMIMQNAEQETTLSDGSESRYDSLTLALFMKSALLLQLATQANLQEESLISATLLPHSIQPQTSNLLLRF